LKLLQMCMASATQIATRSTTAIWLAGQWTPTPQYTAAKSRVARLFVEYNMR